MSIDNKPSGQAPSPVRNGPDRDPNTGKFLRGNKASTGPRVTAKARLDNALRRALSPQDVEDIIRRLCREAVDKGNVKAAAVVLERALGLPRRPSAEVHEAIPLPELSTPQACREALSLLAAAAASGTLDIPAAKTLADLIEAVLRGYEVADLQAQVDLIRERIGA